MKIPSQGLYGHREDMQNTKSALLGVHIFRWDSEYEKSRVAKFRGDWPIRSQECRGGGTHHPLYLHTLARVNIFVVGC